MVGYSDRDMIVAPATPLDQRSSLSMIRVSGEGCWDVLSRCFKSKFDTSLTPWKAVYGDWVDNRGVIDDVVVVPYRAPKSYTGQDMFEITGHGNPVLIEDIVCSILAAGGRRAKPGEFTMRAVLNGKMDLLAAEGVNELIGAHTRFQADMMRRQSKGPMVAQVNEGVEDILQIQAHIEATIDYGEEDIDALQQDVMLGKMNQLLVRFRRLLHTSVFVKGMRRGFRVLITGSPNVGKSSLFNTLVRAERSIVTELPGTTRDLVHENVEICGLPVVLIDSAGVRETGDLVENLGIERIYQMLEDVDLVLYLSVKGDEKPPYDKLLALPEEKWITIRTKADLDDADSRDTVLSISSLTGEGLAALEQEIAKRLSVDMASESVYLINQRQEETVQAVVSLLEKAVEDFDAGYGEEILSSYLNSARHLLGELTGETSVEDILDRMFSNFCLGK